eukprot:scaffold27354_cov21-Tisochrysis_lutea.AAC.1
MRRVHAQQHKLGVLLELEARGEHRRGTGCKKATCCVGWVSRGMSERERERRGREMEAWERGGAGEEPLKPAASTRTAQLREGRRGSGERGEERQSM